MTTFERFRKSVHSNGSNSRVSQKNAIMASVHFSVSQVIFFYDEASNVLISRDLIISNFSDGPVYFRVLTNNVFLYQISPSQDILQSSASRTITIKMKKDKIKLQPYDKYPNFLSKITDIMKDHIFEVQWGLITVQEMRLNKIPELNQKQNFSVKVVEPYSSQLNPVISKVSNFENSGHSKFDFPAKQQQKMSLFKESRNEGGFLMDSENNIIQSRQSLLTTKIITLVAVISFMVGFLSA